MNGHYDPRSVLLTTGTTLSRTGFTDWWKPTVQLWNDEYNTTPKNRMVSA
jgi:hypothetical protein